MKKIISAIFVFSVCSFLHAHAGTESGTNNASFFQKASPYLVGGIITVSSSNPVFMAAGGTLLACKVLYDIFKNHKEPQQEEPPSPNNDIPLLPLHPTRSAQIEIIDEQRYTEPVYITTKQPVIQTSHERTQHKWQSIEPEIPALHDEYADILELYQEMDDPLGVQRYQNRLSALQQTQHNPHYALSKTYSLHQLTTDYLVLHAIDTTRFTQLQGNLFQHQIQQELIDIVEQTREIHDQPCIIEHMEGMPELMVDFASTAVEYNHAYNPIRAAEIADFCWTTINYGKAIIKGIGLGIANPILFAKEHPYQAAAFGALWLLGVGEVIGALQLGIIAGAAWYPIGVRALERAGTEIGKRHWKYINQTITSMLDAFSEQTTEEQITQATALTTDLLIGYKVRGTLSKFFRNALNKIKLFAPKELVAATGDVTVNIAAEFCGVARSGPSNWKDKTSYLKEQINNLYKKKLDNSHIPFSKNNTLSTGKIDNSTSIKVDIMKEFFETKFGKILQKASKITNKKYDHERIYEISSKIPLISNEGRPVYLKKGYFFYLDKMHKDHLEIFDKRGHAKYVIDLAGRILDNKTEQAITQGRKIYL